MESGPRVAKKLQQGRSRVLIPEEKADWRGSRGLPITVLPDSLPHPSNPRCPASALEEQVVAHLSLAVAALPTTVVQIMANPHQMLTRGRMAR